MTDTICSVRMQPKKLDKTLLKFGRSVLLSIKGNNNNLNKEIKEKKSALDIDSRYCLFESERAIIS